MTHEKITALAKKLFKEERSLTRLDGWFLIKELRRESEEKLCHLPPIEKAAEQLKIIAERLPVSISKNAVFAGTQRDAFARSYALINPSFTVKGFSGYCDPTAVYNDIEPNDEFTSERINNMREYDNNTDFVKTLAEVYESCKEDTKEVAYFVEQVTGHVIPDVRPVLKYGVDYLVSEIEEKLKTDSEDKKSGHIAMKNALQAVLILANRYKELALELSNNATAEEKERYLNIAKTLEKVPASGAENLTEAIQSFMLIWQVMCLEQAPNPFAFSVGNADRIFEPYRAAENLSREDAAALFKHLLVFFNVGDRSWAISQNFIVGGRDENGNDLTSVTYYALMDAFYDMNLPQPILSVKLHKNTPDEMYKEMGKFFFTPGSLTPSLFNDDAMFEVLRKSGIEEADLKDYSVAGCQEPLIMGKDNGNTTNSWLNLGKILELTLTGGKSLISGELIGEKEEIKDDFLETLKERFYKRLENTARRMATAANAATAALSLLPVPFLSTLMGGIETGFDMRDISHKSTKYNGSGCLIHGSSVVADSFVAVQNLLRDKPEQSKNLIKALECDFNGYEELREYLLAQPKFGNNNDVADYEAAEICQKTAQIVSANLNCWGNKFRPDFSTPSTHLTYGYWVGALPDGRKAREMMNYGVDPLYGDANLGLGFRTLSTMKLPFECMCGGYTSHFGIDPKYFKGETNFERGLEFKTKVIAPLFFNEMQKGISPFYLYLNITTPETLRKVLENPKKYAPSGVYIMRIHGTFVNFLDLSPEIQQDIITRLDLKSTVVC